MANVSSHSVSFLAEFHIRSSFFRISIHLFCYILYLSFRCYDKWLMVIIKPVNVFLIVDVQNDFIDGTLALKDLGLGQDGTDVVQPINCLIKECPWDKIIYSLDWHPSNHIGFYDNLHLRELHPQSKVYIYLSINFYRTL